MLGERAPYPHPQRALGSSPAADDCDVVRAAGSRLPRADDKGMERALNPLLAVVTILLSGPGLYSIHGGLLMFHCLLRCRGWRRLAVAMLLGSFVSCTPQDVETEAQGRDAALTPDQGRESQRWLVDIAGVGESTLRQSGFEVVGKRGPDTFVTLSAPETTPPPGFEARTPAPAEKIGHGLMERAQREPMRRLAAEVLLLTDDETLATEIVTKSGALPAEGGLRYGGAMWIVAEAAALRSLAEHPRVRAVLRRLETPTSMAPGGLAPGGLPGFDKNWSSFSEQMCENYRRVVQNQPSRNSPRDPRGSQGNGRGASCGQQPPFHTHRGPG